jgi:hypothetical protein
MLISSINAKFVRSSNCNQGVFTATVFSLVIEFKSLVYIDVFRVKRAVLPMSRFGKRANAKNGIVRWIFIQRTVLIANNIRLMSKEMEPKVSINDLKKIRSFSRQRNMVREEIFFNFDVDRGFFRTYSRRWLVPLLHRSTVMNISNEPFCVCYSVEQRKSCPMEHDFEGKRLETIETL